MKTHVKLTLICSCGVGVVALSASRRDALQRISAVGTATASLSSTLFLPQACEAAPPLPLQTSSGGTARIEEVGGGLDLLSPKPLSASEVFYPSSMTNTRWRVQ